MRVEILGNAIPLTDGSGEVHRYRYRARVVSVPGWELEFELGSGDRDIHRLTLERSAKEPHRSLATTALRQINPAELIEAASNEWILETDPVVVAPDAARWDRPDGYLMALATAALRLQARGRKRGRNVELGHMFNRSASQVSDDLRKCREDGWLTADNTTKRGKGRALTLLPGAKLLDAQERNGSPEGGR